MTITFTTSPENFEKANYILAEAIRQFYDRLELLADFGLSVKDLERADTFRRALVKGFTKAAENV